jgi:hypothetical protein
MIPTLQMLFGILFVGVLIGGNLEEYRQTGGRRRVDCIPTCILNRSSARVFIAHSPDIGADKRYRVWRPKRDTCNALVIAQRGELLLWEQRIAAWPPLLLLPAADCKTQ